MHCSMSRKANCWDNAPTESLFQQSEDTNAFHGRRYRTGLKPVLKCSMYIEAFYNRNRRHSTLGYISPLSFLQKGARASTKRRHRRYLLEAKHEGNPHRRGTQTLCLLCPCSFNLPAFCVRLLLFSGSI
jgi:hypothetical protein